MKNFIKILQITGEVGGILALLIAPYLYFENRKLRRLAARKNRKIAQEELEKLERNEEASFEEKMRSLDSRAFGMENYDTTETEREVNTTIRKRENYFNDALKLKAEIEEQEEIENMSTFRGLLGLKPKEDISFSSLVPKQTFMTRIRKRFKKFFLC